VFIADDVILFPFKSILFICREIYNAAIQEIASEADAIRTELSQLYLALEGGSLTEAAFDARESDLLDRLDEIEERGVLEDEEEEGDDDEDDLEEEDEEEEEEEEEDSDDELNTMTSPMGEAFDD
jgi:hypothetical protein